MRNKVGDILNSVWFRTFVTIIIIPLILWGFNLVKGGINIDNHINDTMIESPQFHTTQADKTAIAGIAKFENSIKTQSVRIGISEKRLTVLEIRFEGIQEKVNETYISVKEMNNKIDNFLIRANNQ